MISKLKDMISIARPDDWPKNVFIIPGIVIGVAIAGGTIDWATIVIGIFGVCLVASANYVLNEWVDAPFDRFHKVKSQRPIAQGRLSGTLVAMEYIVLVCLGLFLSYLVNWQFFWCALLLLIMGIIYNVEPLRFKDKHYGDVLTESINNPIRLMLGWYMVGANTLPPSSLLIGYWMGGAFLMAIKRFAEYRFINDPKKAGQYRKSFQKYTQDSLLVSVFFYAMASAFFTGVFLVKYRVELILSLPFLAVLFAWYFYMGLKPNSITQNPEHLFKEHKFFAYMVALTGFIFYLMTHNIGWVEFLLSKNP